MRGEWRFARTDIHHWLETRIGLADEEDIVDVQNLLRGGESEQEISIADMLPVEAIAIPLARGRETRYSRPSLSSPHARAGCGTLRR